MFMPAPVCSISVMISDISHILKMLNHIKPYLSIRNFFEFYFAIKIYFYFVYQFWCSCSIQPESSIILHNWDWPDIIKDHPGFESPRQCFGFPHTGAGVSVPSLSTSVVRSVWSRTTSASVVTSPSPMMTGTSTSASAVFLQTKTAPWRRGMWTAARVRSLTSTDSPAMENAGTTSILDVRGWEGSASDTETCAMATLCVRTGLISSTARLVWSAGDMGLTGIRWRGVGRGKIRPLVMVSVTIPGTARTTMGDTTVWTGQMRILFSRIHQTTSTKAHWLPQHNSGTELLVARNSRGCPVLSAKKTEATGFGATIRIATHATLFPWGIPPSVRTTHSGKSIRMRRTAISIFLTEQWSTRGFAAQESGITAILPFTWESSLTKLTPGHLLVKMYFFANPPHSIFLSSKIRGLLTFYRLRLCQWLVRILQ